MNSLFLFGIVTYLCSQMYCGYSTQRRCDLWATSKCQC